MPFTIAIDGPAAAGKGTISKAVAAALGYAHLDTGLLYRATGRRVLDGLEPLAAAQALMAEDLLRDGLRTPDVAQAASRVAALPDVRAALVDFQRAFARRQGGAVLDGRDIGTVICPDAEVKLFVTASAEIRAQRRLAELLAGGHDVTAEQVLADVRERDARDMDRADAPLKPATDAVRLDTSELDIDTAIARALEIIRARHAAAAGEPGDGTSGGGAAS
ncbi:MAG: d(CMP) kinase [Celeribacter sp.]|jgi:cytidylate kinase